MMRAIPVTDLLDDPQPDQSIAARPPNLMWFAYTVALNGIQTRLHTPPFTLNYALGWSVGDDGRLYHAGSTYRWCSEASINPSSKVVAVAAANANDEVIRRAVTETLTAARRRGERLDSGVR
jgi:hypothetical protein